jgi:anaerobic magnesium-protoporphyrin IX monomethyl ester cyclase
MRIVFVVPYTTSASRYGNLAGAGSFVPPLGLCQLAAITQREGHETHIIDAPTEGLPHEQVLEKIQEYKPDIVGITAVTMTVLMAGELAKMVKKADKNIVTVVGGPHVSALPEDSLERFPSIDYIVVGEGEETLLELINRWEQGGDPADIRGIAYRSHGSIKTTPDRPFIEDLDGLPFPAWGMLSGFPQVYNLQVQSIGNLPSTSVCTSRGCPGRCTFCDRRVFGNRFRANRAEYVINLIKYLYYHHGVRDIQFEDDFFTLHRKRLYEICEELIRLDLDLTWSCQARVKSVNPDMLSKMKQAKCWSVLFGVESGNQGVLDTMRKEVTLEDISKAVTYTSEAGILSKGFFITGNVGETKETLKETRDFVMNNKFDDISLHYLCPFPGSIVYEVADQYGTFDKDWTKMNFYNAVFVPKGLTEKDLIRHTKLTYLRFYIRLKTIYNYLKRIRTRKQFLLFVKAGLSLFNYILKKG